MPILPQRVHSPWRFTAGRPRNDGSDITGLPTHQIVRRGIACIPEGRRVFPRMTVRDNLRMGAYREADSAPLGHRMAGVFEICPRLRKRIGQLGGTMFGGEQAMLYIARGLMATPSQLKFSEPSMGLSPLSEIST